MKMALQVFLYVEVLVFTLTGASFAQQGRVLMSDSTNTNHLLEVYKQINEARKSIPGYRVQIHFGGEREKAKEVKSKFLSQYHQVQAYESYQSPNFRVRVGDFRTRLEAINFQKKISANFPAAYVVQDLVSLPEITQEGK
jgi:hypothetical protein